MKKRLKVLTLCAVLNMGNAYAHGDHDEPAVISPEGAISIANKSVQQLTFKELGFAVGKLDASWKTLTAQDLSVVSIEDSFYVVSAKNSESTLYFKVAFDGQVMDVTHTNE